MKISEVAEKLFVIEKQLNLFEQKIQGVYFWKLIRFGLYKNILEHLRVTQTAHTQEFNSIFDKIYAVVPKMKNTYFHSVFARRFQVDVLVVEHGRKVFIDNEYIDIYTEHKIKELDTTNTSYEIVDRPYLGRHYHKPSKNRSYFESTTLKYLIQKFFQKNVLTTDEKRLIESIQNELFKNFGFKKNLEVLIANKVKLFELKKKQYKQMLIKRKVKQVYLVVSYGQEDLISACQELDIECIEIQHGIMNRYHLGYSFPYNSLVAYFPDKIELFGKYWQDNTPLALSSKKISITGYPYLFDTLKQFKYLTKKKNQVVFLSQGTSGDKLAQFVYSFAKKNAEYQVVYKLHPGEFGRWRESYPILLEALKLNNFELVESEKHLYHILKESSFVVGINSTAIYESLLLDCKVILLDLPGMKEYMQPLLELKVAKKVSSIDEMKVAMNENGFAKVDSNYFFME